MSDKVNDKVLTDLVTLSNGVEHEGTQTVCGSLRVVDVEPYRTELARMGRRFGFSAGVVANAQAPVTDFPTTTAAYALYNGEAAGGKSYIVEYAVATAASGTMGLGAALLAGVTNVAQSSAVANGTGVVLGNLSGMPSSSSLAKFGNGITLAAAPAWIPVATTQQPAAIQVGAGPGGFLDGMFIVRPGCCLGLTVFAPAGTTAKYGISVVWSELQLTNLNS